VYYGKDIPRYVTVFSHSCACVAGDMPCMDSIWVLPEALRCLFCSSVRYEPD
jgi:hypothetical protein